METYTGSQADCPAGAYSQGGLCEGRVRRAPRAEIDGPLEQGGQWGWGIQASRQRRPRLHCQAVQAWKCLLRVDSEAQVVQATHSGVSAEPWCLSPTVASFCQRGAFCGAEGLAFLPMPAPSLLLHGHRFGSWLHLVCLEGCLHHPKSYP